MNDRLGPDCDTDVKLQQTSTDLPVLSQSVSHTSPHECSQTEVTVEAGEKDTTRNGSDDEAESFPEGGREAWLVVFGSFISMVASFGVMNTISTFHAHLSKHQLSEYSQGQIGWIFGLYSFVSFSGGIYIGPLFDTYGPRWILLAGSVCLISGLVFTSVSKLYWQYFLSFGILTGLGSCLIFTPAVAAVGHWFCKRRGWATGIATTGGSIGGIIYPLIIQGSTPRVGFGWAVRIVAFVALTSLLIGNLLIKGRNAILEASRNPPASSSSSSTSADTHSSPKKKSIYNIKIDVGAFKDPRFAWTTFGVFLIEWGLFVPLTYITFYSLNIGLPQALSYQLLAVLNAGSVFGRWVPGLISDRIGRFNTMLLTVSLCFACCVCFWLPSAYVTSPVARKTLLVFFALFYGFGSGSGISLTPVCVGQICDVKEYGTKFGTCYFFVSFGTLTGIPIAGEIVKASGGSYTGLVVFTAASYVGAFVCFGVARWCGTGKWRTVF